MVTLHDGVEISRAYAAANASYCYLYRYLFTLCQSLFLRERPWVVYANFSNCACHELLPK